jgi:hypothetical protein
MMTNFQDKPNIFQALNNAAINFSETFQTINKIWVNAAKAFLQYDAQIRQAIQAIPLAIDEALKNGAEKMKTDLITLGQYGWYISMNMPASVPVKIAEKLLAGEVDDVNRLMCDYFEKNWEELKEDIVEMCPSRSILLDRAFAAHQRGEYELSIPVFLAQSDGICKELAGYELFRKKGGVPATSEFVDQFTADSIMMALLEPFRSPMPISASEKERQGMQVPFNRHQILHGEVVDYGTRVNSCRAISLLAYVYSVLKMAKESK